MMDVLVLYRPIYSPGSYIPNQITTYIVRTRINRPRANTPMHLEC